MSKEKIQYVCLNCGATSPKWIGKCPICNEWNTYSEEIISVNKNSSSNKSKSAELFYLSEIQQNTESRIAFTFSEFNRVLGGGMVLGSVNLLAGEPGIGKSTLSLQLVLKLKDRKIIYFSGEESLSQIKMRAERIEELFDNNALFSNEKNLESILKTVEKEKPELVIIDSIQTVYSEKNDFLLGSISQMKECAQQIIEVAKQKDIPFILIGHINKDGAVAGPKVLEHMVDAVFQFEGDRHNYYRVLRPLKNRFGSTSEIGIFEMTQKGMREVINPSEFLVTQVEKDSGITVGSFMEGGRNFFVEIQALVTNAVYAAPQRVVTGYDAKRLNMILAVLEKKQKLKIGNKDVFLNVVGGIKVSDVSVDLAVLIALVSSYFDQPVSTKVCFVGEVGLSGEILPVKKIDQRIAESQKIGYETVFVSELNKILLDDLKINIIFVSRISDVIRLLFKNQ